MASPLPLGIPRPAPERLGRDVGSAIVTTTHASAEAAAAVSPSRDVIFEILSWLPAKSLGRCRCVSKEWRALISDRAFVAAHTSRAEPLLVAMTRSMLDRTLLLLDTDGAVVKVVKDDQGEPQRLGGDWTLRASHDGLACISSGHDDSGMLVVDLATGETLLACFKPVEETGGYLCFGFGRATQSGSIKVFRLVIPRRGVHTRTCEVLTLGEGARWRQTKSPPTRLSCTSGVAVNGALHFLSEDKCDVLSFDLDNEKWKLIHGPEDGMEVITIAHLNGALCMAQRLHRVINIWLLSDSDKNIWIKAYTMPAPLFGFQMPLRVLRPGRELLFCGYDYTGNLVLQVYHPRLGRCTQVKTQANLSGKIGLCSSSLDPRFCGQSDPR